MYFFTLTVFLRENCSPDKESVIPAADELESNSHTCVLENISAWFAVNFLLLLCLHILCERVAATGIDW